MSGITQSIATRALITNQDGQVLLIRESGSYQDGTNAGKWDVPGGRLDARETFEDGMRREVKEETGLDIAVGRPVAMGEWRPTINGVRHQIVAVFCECQAASEMVQLSNDHDGYLWVGPGDYTELELMQQVRIALDSHFTVVREGESI